MGKHPKLWFLAITFALMIPTWFAVSCERRQARDEKAPVTGPKETR